jgi:flagellar protein FlgJ
MKDPVQQVENKVAAPQESAELETGTNVRQAPELDMQQDQQAENAAAHKAAAKPLTKQGKFIQSYAASAISLEKKDGIPALFTLAQGALESGWGEKAIGNALFGIKAGANWKGKKQLVTTTEYFKDDKQGHRFPEVISITEVTEGKNKGKYKYKVKDWFRDYDTVEEGLADHSAFLMTNKRYAGAFNTETPDDFAQAVADAGYATDPSYASTLKSMIASIKKHWPESAGSIPAGNSKAVTGGKPGGAKPDPAKDNKPGGEKQPTATTGDKPAAAPTKGKTITASVGENGVNNPQDALVIKELMIKAGYDLTMVPDIGPKTIGYIKDFQAKKLGWKNPDGLIEPGGSTFKALLGGQTAEKPSTKPAGKPSADKPTTTEKPSLDVKGLAEKLHTAMFGGMTGLGTDEEAIYAALRQLGQDASKIQALKAAYKSKYGSELTADLRSELSDSILGNELSAALNLLTPKTDGPAAKGDSKPKPVQEKKPETAPATKQETGSVGAKLDKFYNDFANIKVVHGDKTVIVKPPYHINDGKRKTAALAARAANPTVNEFINKLASAKKITGNAKVGKSQPADIKTICEAAVDAGLVKHDSAELVDFLAKYGLSVDCSGYVSQALNFLLDGNMTQDGKDNLKPGNVGSGSLKGGTDNFTKVAIGDVVAGDTMHLSGHIRIINEVVKEGGIVYFRTAESTAAVNPKDNENGLMKRWWKWDGKQKYTSWENQSSAHPKADSKTWKASNEANTFGRYKKL